MSQVTKIPNHHAMSRSHKFSNRKARILVVDDEPENLFLLEMFLKKIDCHIETCTDPRKVPALFEHKPFDLAILDIMMPHMSGLELCKWIKNDVRFADCCVIFSTALQSEAKLDEALEVGAMDYLVKPIKSHEIIARAKSALRFKFSLDETHRSHAQMHGALISLKNKHNQVNSALKKLSKSMKELRLVQNTVLFALSKLAESRDNETGKHLMRTQAYVELIARTLQKDEKYADTITEEYLEGLVMSAPLHDIGKVGIPDYILLKKGRLTPEEFRIMKSHPIIGARTLIEAADQVGHRSFLELAIDITNYHHEKNDGSGYPEGLKGDDIPLAARIMSLADIYDALRCRRCYKEPLSHEESREIILNENGEKYFHPDVMQAFLDNEEKFKEISFRLKDDPENEMTASP